MFSVREGRVLRGPRHMIVWDARDKVDKYTSWVRRRNAFEPHVTDSFLPKSRRPGRKGDPAHTAATDSSHGNVTRSRRETMTSVWISSEDEASRKAHRAADETLRQASH